MHELHQLEILRKLGTVPDQNLDLAHVGKHPRRFDIPFPSEVGEFTGEGRFEVAAGDAEIGNRSSSASVITACASIEARVDC